jgi:ESS family glutamate:Na+ symporter
MIIGIVGGMTLIQWAHRRGYVREVRTFSDRKWCERVGIHPRGRRPIAGIQTVASDSIDSLAWHCAVIGLSVAIGWALHSFIPIKGFPLFPLCMIGGVLIMLAAKLVKQDLLIDRTQMEHVSGAALDYLIVSAVATIRLDVVAENWMPLLILILSGSLWSAAAVVFIAPRIFKKSWFECAIAEFGQATGVTATGLMLLRTVDPENRTQAAMSFGYKQLLHEPIMGGGFWTAFAFTLVFTIGWVKVFFISLIMLAIFSALSVIISKSGGRSNRA